MKVVVDENMPYARELFSRNADVIAVPGRPLPLEALHQADALMVRSVTPITAQLLAGTSLKFVGSATAGTDHVDQSAVAAAGLAFSAAPGCNAIAVVEYVLSALLMLAEQDGYALSQRTIGIVGVGNVGSRLQKRCEALGMRVLLCDPPRAERGDDQQFATLATLVEHADILTFHTPLTTDGPYPTWHMADHALLTKLRPGTVLINACRGAVVDNHALNAVLSQRPDLRVVLDVWEPEPELDRQLLAKVDLGTAHIAGYTLEGKARGTTQLYEAWSHFIGKEDKIDLATLLPAPNIGEVTVQGEFSQAILKRLVHLVYDVRQDDALLRQHINEVGGFDRLRKNYAERREWSSLRPICQSPATAAMLCELGFSAIHRP